jgi:hypothetical protein
MSGLPYAEKAVVPVEKLPGYALNRNHEQDRHKARVVASALGLTAEDA